MANMGIAQTGHQNRQLLRKNRWFFSIVGTSADAMSHNETGPSHIYLASRPKVSFDQRQVSHQVESPSYNGRATWDPIDITFWDVAGDNRIYNWLRKHMDPETGQLGYRHEYVVNCQLDMLNGRGDLVERWLLHEAHAASIDWGDVDYSSNDLASVTINLSYVRAIREAQPVPPGGKARYQTT
jgi:hypothetical protein